MLHVQIFAVILGLCVNNTCRCQNPEQVADMALQIRLLVSPSLSPLNISLGRAEGSRLPSCCIPTTIPTFAFCLAQKSAFCLAQKRNTGHTSPKQELSSDPAGMQCALSFRHLIKKPELWEACGGVWQPLFPDVTISLQPAACHVHGLGLCSRLSNLSVEAMAKTHGK